MMSTPDGHARMRGTQETMEQFVNFLTFQVDKPVVNATGLTGRYNFILSWVGKPLPSLPANPAERGSTTVELPGRI